MDSAELDSAELLELAVAMVERGLVPDDPVSSWLFGGLLEHIDSGVPIAQALGLQRARQKLLSRQCDRHLYAAWMHAGCPDDAEAWQGCVNLVRRFTGGRWRNWQHLDLAPFCGALIGELFFGAKCKPLPTSAKRLRLAIERAVVGQQKEDSRPTNFDPITLGAIRDMNRQQVRAVIGRLESELAEAREIAQLWGVTDDQ